MRKLLVTLLVTLLVGVTGMAYAYSGSGSWHIEDNYVGADDHGYGDVIGPPNFDIASMDITISGTTMTVKVNTPFKAGTYFGKPVDYGDLFISTNGWSPFGTAPYPLDDASTSLTTWGYAFDVSAGKLYNITGAQAQILHSDDMGLGGLIFRNDQDVLIDPTGLNPVGLGNFDASNPGYVEMSFDISALTYQPGVQWGLRWEMTCANDVIEGSFDPVPEPSTVLLLGAGLLGLAAFGRKHLKK